MDSMQIRRAAASDSRALANLHLACSAELPDRLENQLGPGYLASYYRVFLSEPQSLILCTELDDQRLAGLISGVDNYSDHLQYMHTTRWRLLAAAIPSLARQPHLLKRLRNLQRQPWIAGIDETSAIAAHVTFWCWRPQAQPAGGGVVLLQAWLAAARLRGARRAFFDVDIRNPRAIAIHRTLGARIEIQEFSDGSQQCLISYDLDEAPADRAFS
jgi:ribosomal protein S18 acetylase RimI-like enzyme